LLNDATVAVQEDINQALEGWKVFLQTRKSVEEPLLDTLTKSYTQAIQENTISAYETFLKTLDSYKDTIILPENKKILENYKKVVQTNLQQLKFKDFEKQVTDLATNLNNLPFGDTT
jgi:hypothetical protein